MIPASIEADHVRRAAAEIERQGIPNGRDATKFLVIVDDQPFPPKAVLSAAAKIATGAELDSSEFSGGDEANRFLEKLGFQVILKNRDWSEEECLLAVWAYDRMDQNRGLVKKHLYKEIAQLTGRTAKAVEYKVQNVSACDPRPRAEKPVSEAANNQHLLRDAFTRYWADHTRGRQEAEALRASRLPGLLPWDLALARIRASKSPNSYMPIAVLAALELIREGEGMPDHIPFDRFEIMFDALQTTLGEGAVGMAWEPFLFLASTAKVWTLKKGADTVAYSRESRPKSRSQLLKIAESAAFIPELRSGVADPSLVPRLKALIGAAVPRASSDADVLTGGAKALKGKLGPEPPKGNEAPKKERTNSTSYVRDPKVVRWVLDRAAGVCELCRRPAPFKDPDGDPFLEVHHVVHLAEGGADTVENARALCPNCHRELHFGAQAGRLRSILLQ